MPDIQSITTAQPRRSEHTARRMRRYLISMGIRMAGLIGAVFTDGWVMWTCIVLAVLLPYVAVVLGSESVAKTSVPTAYTPEPLALPPGRTGAK